MYQSLGQLKETKVFKDPVHRYIYVDDQLIWQLIGTKEFQRLRRIKQLGTSFLTFHGAEHTRFHHSLGVYEITRQLINVFNGRPEWDDQYRELALCAALLHDVGHGPFSHAFENVFGVEHETWTERIILGDTEIKAVLDQVGDGFAEEVAAVIRKTHPNKLLVTMISSQLDVDRMDYLLRDAHFAGVSYGTFDLERMLRVLRPSRDQLVVKQSGMHSIEDYIMRRYQMYWQVYLHPVTRSSDYLLKAILERAQELYAGHYDFTVTPFHLIPLFEQTMTLKDYLALDETIVYFYFQQWMEEEDKVLSDLASRFVNRKLFKYVDYPQEKRDAVHERLCLAFSKIGLDPDYYLLEDKLSRLPYDLYLENGEISRHPIMLQMKDGTLKEISQVSPLVRAIATSRQTDEKLFFPQEELYDLKEFANEKMQIDTLLRGDH
ncbi:HD domain-containing protein [Exiguobacterium flavidum]|uniref:HD domain-containing protein n=1 Tax=Exiguobacterium flavidum TaxID=2184695 RepID=UPI000DF826F9|nr:HD domain-containing protein [Exiguobacterium flavidum]